MWCGSADYVAGTQRRGCPASGYQLEQSSWRPGALQRGMTTPRRCGRRAGTIGSSTPVRRADSERRTHMRYQDAGSFRHALEHRLNNRGGRWGPARAYRKRVRSTGF